MKNKVMTAQKAVESINDGAIIMVGGFMATGTPEILVDALVEKGVKDLTIICNDAGVPGRGVGKLISNEQVKKLIASHVGLNGEVGERMNEGRLECILVPQGTLAEQVRASGCGLGGILTPTGVGTIVAEGKEEIQVKGKKYLLEEPISADFALIRGSVTDKFGNTVYNKATQNFNPLMAMAAKNVIVGTERLVDIGKINSNHVHTSGIFIDVIVEGEKPWTV